MNENQLKKFKEADWSLIRGALIKYSVKKAAQKHWKSIGLPMGIEPADLANRAIEKTLNGILGEDGEAGQRKWNESLNPELLDHLKDVIDSDLSNLVNSEEHKKMNYSAKLEADIAQNLLMMEVDSVRQTPSAEEIFIARDEEEASVENSQMLMSNLLNELEGDEESQLVVMAFEWKSYDEQLDLLTNKSTNTFEEMLELASLGAKVLHPRSVEIARNFGVKMSVRSSWLDDAGTVITSPKIGRGNLKKLEINRFVETIAIDYDQVKIALLQIPDRPGIASQLFASLAEQGINVDLIIQAVQETEGVNDIAFTIPQNQLRFAELVARSLEIGASSVTVDSNVAKISIIGVGMIGRPGVAAQMFTALAKAGINIQMISTSEIKISCVIAATDGEAAIAALQETFGVPVQLDQFCAINAERMTETAPVRGVALDRNRARIAVQQVPDRPGMAAQILEQLVDQNISLDMIVQSQSDRDVNEIAFTVAIADLAKAETTLKQYASVIGYGKVTCDGDISKVSIVGSNMIHQSGIAARMFSALADAGINIEMIATSEIKVSCVVRDHQAEQALKVIHQEFNLSGDRAIEVPSVLKS